MHYVGHVDWSFTDQPAPASANVDRASPALRIVGPDAGRRPHRARGRRARRRAAGSRRHFHSFEEALYVLAGELLIELDGHVHRLAAGRLRAHADRDLARARQRRGASRSAGSRSTRRSGSIRPTRAARHVLRDGAARPRRPGRRAPSGRRSATRAPARSATTTARRRRPRRSASSDPARGRAPAGHGHGAPRLQRDLGEDAGRPRRSAPTC